MGIVNYLFIGVLFTFIIDVIIGMKKTQNHPAVKEAFEGGAEWGIKERIACIIFWPIAAFVFFRAFFNQFGKK